ncbi:hypothetical protein ACQ4M3_38910 [Leptolyngbya sp. AN03gr2]|uniref:hypothetical protein n=1 Tax=unclassified Leptolyngbya TaxID=2650499 RepID=UPI003D31F063
MIREGANPINMLLSIPEVRAEVFLKITIEVASPVQPEGTGMKAIVFPSSALAKNAAS